MSVSDPEELPRLFAERASAGDLDGLIDLYEDGATLVRADGVPASGVRELREDLENLLAMAPRIVANGSRAVRAGDIALMSSGWRRLALEGAERQGYAPSVEAGELVGLLITALGNGLALEKLADPDAIPDALYGDMLALIFRAFEALARETATAAESEVGDG